MVNDKTHALLAALADGQPHTIQQLLLDFGVSLSMLNGIRQTLPVYWQPYFRQQGGCWQLKRLNTVMHQADPFWQQQKSSFLITVLPRCSSTNDYLKTRVGVEPVHQQVVIANEQTAGRGRQGRVWQSKLGDCLTFSLAWVFKQKQSQLGALALVVALAIHETLQKHQVTSQIKWPNDIVLGQHKMGGILIESKKEAHGTALVVGIGLNFALPTDIEQDSTSVWADNEACICKVWLVDLLQKIETDFTLFEQVGFTPFIDRYHAAHRDIGQEVGLYRQGELFTTGRVMGVDTDGALILQNAKGVEKVVSGEVSLRVKGHKMPMPKNNKNDKDKGMAKNLLLDAGNSQLKWALVQQGEIIDTGKAPYSRLEGLTEFFQAHDGIVKIVGCAVCGTQKIQAVEEHLPMTITWLNSMPKGLGIINHYIKPEEHGADRWFNVLGSRRFTKDACVVVSCGTAITIDALTEQNHYLGGSIMPGFNLMKEAMALKTANLNQPVGRAYPFATSTANAIASGMLDAACGAILLMHQRLKEKTLEGKTVKVLLTGGGAKKIEVHLSAAFAKDAQVQIVDNLVIYGLLNWIEQS